MRDALLFAHVIGGLVVTVAAVLILLHLGKRSSLSRPLAALAAAASWLLLLPAGVLYLLFYPATKTLIKAGSWPWAHAVVMETKEHWGLLLPIIATVAAVLVFSGREQESRKWWILTAVLSVWLAVLGRVVKMGAGV